jgi:hypothetical protein
MVELFIENELIYKLESHDITELVNGVLIRGMDHSWRLFSSENIGLEAHM